MDSMGVNEERKKELVMEKRLRACRVNIIPRNGGYLSDPYIPPPVIKQKPQPLPSPLALEKATNPVALRYWNQCMDKTAEKEINDITSPQLERKNKKQGSEVINVLSTAGTGIKRDNEVKEALGNINRFFTIDNIKKDDAVRMSRSRSRQENVIIDDVDNKPYNQIKEEQIQLSRQREQFQNLSANRIPNSPKPFRRGVSETRLKSTSKNLACNYGKPNINNVVHEIVPKLDEQQKTQLGLVLFDQLPSHIVEAMVVQQLSTMSGARLQSVMDCLSNEVKNVVL